MEATQTEQPERPDHRFLLVGVLIGVAAVCWAGIRTHTGWGGALPGWALTVASTMTAALACRATARSSAAPVVRAFWNRTAWSAGLLSAGMASVAAGHVGTVPYAELAGAIFCTLGVLVLASALMGLPVAHRRRHEWFALVLDAGTVLVAVALYVWYAYHRFGDEISSALDTLTVIWLGLAAALGALTVVRIGLSLQCPVRRLELALLGLGVIAAGAVGGVSSAVFEHPHFDDAHLSGPVGALFWVVAAFTHRASPPVGTSIGHDSPRLPFNVLPYAAAVAVGGLTLAAAPPTTPERVVVHGGVLFVMLVLARQITAAYDNARLLRRVDDGMLELRHHEQRFRSMVQQATDIIVITTPEGVIDYASPNLRQLVGLHGDGVGARITDFVHPEDLPLVSYHALQVATKPAGVATFRIRVSDGDGGWRWLEIVSTNLLADPSVRGIVSNARDITDMLHYQEQLAHRATHDELTGLPNRVLLLERIRSTLNVDPEARAGVAMFDLDDFKSVNDRFGHDIGDALLVGIGKLLSGSVGPNDTVARLGGDEFAVVLASTSPRDSARALDRIMSKLNKPIVAAGYELLVQASIGLADGVHGDDPVELLRRADIALYNAKDTGKGRHIRYEADMDKRSVEHAQIGAELRQALDAGDQLYLLYQPIVGLPDGQVNGVEALVRWRHPERGTVSPVDFIPLAERTGLIIPLGLWILREACGQAARWAAQRHTAGLTISVNVSARQLRDPGFPGDLAAILAETNLAPSRLTVEVTETAVFDSGVAVEALRAIHALGVRVALDDFGTGHSSLGLLRSCPVDILKVDKSFVDGVTGTAEQAAIAISLIQITSTMRLKAVAEGVETAEQASTLHRLGYRFAQGFHFARPLPSEEVGALLNLTVDPAPEPQPRQTSEHEPKHEPERAAA